MQIIRPPDYRVMPWKNGGGETTEIFVSPAAENFDWRVSIAAVGADGPFSTFDGYDRHIMTLSGNGMKLDIEGRGITNLRPLESLTFSGDVRVVGSLVNGPVHDFNLMVRRDFGQGTLCVMNCGAGHVLGSGQSHHLFHVLEGECGVGGERVCSHDSFYVATGERVFLTGPLKLVNCKITPR